jgi:KDO2-lipid IV(A) lauroyltransferase
MGKPATECATAPRTGLRALVLERLFRVAAFLPLWLAHALGALLGWVAYLSSGAYRSQLRGNLERACPERFSTLLGSAVAHGGRTVLEMPRVWLRRREDVLGLVREVLGWDRVEAARANGQGLIFVTPHLGCFEITSLYIASRMPITVLYRPPKQAWLRPIMLQGRSGQNITQAATDLGGVRLLMKALKRREAIGLLPDQVPGKGEGVWAEFFGRPAYTMTLLARLTEIENTTLVFLYGERLPRGAGFRLRFVPPPVPVAGSPAERTTAINRCVEALIRECPSQYLWGYNRYKRPAGAEPPPDRDRA